MNKRLLLVGCIIFLFAGALAAQQPPGPMGGGGDTQGPAAGGGSSLGPVGPMTPAGGGAAGGGAAGSKTGGGPGPAVGGGGPMGPSGGPPMGMGMPGMGSGVGAEKDVKSMTLEELLAKALRDNPDIRVAETKVREAEAELNRTRLHVMQRVTQLREEISAAQAMVQGATERHQMAMKMRPQVSGKEEIESRIGLLKAKAELAKLEPELSYLVGKQSAAKSMGATMSAPVFIPLVRSVGMETVLEQGVLVEGALPKKLPDSVTDKIRKALDTEVLLRQSDMTLHDAVYFHSDKMQGLNVHISDKKLTETKIQMYLLRPVPLGAVFQYFEDELNCKCVVREYGIVICPRDRTPPGAPLLLDIWKERASTKTDDTKSK